MNLRLPKHLYFSSLLILFCSLSTLAGKAEVTSSGITLYTPYTEISVPPGQTISYSINVINNSSQKEDVYLSLSGLSKSWDYTLKSGGWNIRRISVLPKQQKTVTLQLTVPLKINKGVYHFYLRGGGTDLPLRVIVSKKGTYKTAFSTKQPDLEGAANTTFTYNANLKNETADTLLYALNAQAPPGWQVTFKASYKQVASVEVNANQTQRITISIKPPDQVPAGTYKIPVYASTEATSATLGLEVVVTGSYNMELTTPSGRLSTDINAGGEKRVRLYVRNTGSAPLKKISLDYQAPDKWDVTFDPKKIAELPAGKSAQVFATIKANKDAIAGDYVTDMTAKTAETSSKAEFRVSVDTPVFWGWIGVLIILIALGSVYFLFRKYGRR